MKHNKNFFDNFPNTQGLVVARDVFNNHLFTMWTDNIRARTRQIDTEFYTNTGHWGEGRRLIAEAAGAIVWSYFELPGLSKDEIISIGKQLDSQSESKKN